MYPHHRDSVTAILLACTFATASVIAHLAWILIPEDDPKAFWRILDLIWPMNILITFCLYMPAFVLARWTTHSIPIIAFVVPSLVIYSAYRSFWWRYEILARTAAMAVS